MAEPFRRRFIDANEKTEAPGQHIVVQVAAGPAEPGGRGQLAFAGAAAVCWRWDAGRVSREVEAEFASPRDWWNWLDAQLGRPRRRPVRDAKTGRTVGWRDGSPTRRTWIWSRGAHAAFLLLGGWERVAAKLIRVGFLLDKDPPWVLRFKVGRLPCTWLDARNFFDQAWVEGAPAWECARYQADRVQELLHWHMSTDLGCLGFTAADLAMRAYRHRFAPRLTRGELTDKDPGPAPARVRPICWPVPHDRKPVHDDERASYYGPLFVCHQLGAVKGPIYVVDCQSHYASMMHRRPFPAQYLFSVSHPDPEKSRALAESYSTIAAVRLCSPDWPYPVRRGGRVGLAVGRFTTVLPGPELLHAIERGAVEVVYALHCFRPVELFTTFVAWFWNQRCAARHQQNKMIESLCKDVLVKMTGKWAQVSDRWEVDPKRRAVKSWGYDRRWSAARRKDVSLRYLGDVVQVHAGRKQPSYYFPAVSAYITSYARLHVAHVVDQIGVDEVYYNPVDCLHVSALGWGRLQKLGLVQEPALGKFRLERVIQKVHYLAPGAYVRDDEPVVCGLPKGARHAGGGRYDYRRVETCCEVFGRDPSDQLRTIAGSADLDSRQLWGRERADGRVFPPVLDEPDEAAAAEESLKNRTRMEELNRASETRPE